MGISIQPENGIVHIGPRWSGGIRVGGGRANPNDNWYQNGSDLANSVVAYWKLNEASGNRADSVGANTLTDGNTAGSRAGVVHALSADFIRANAEYLYVADNAAVSLGNLDFWFVTYFYMDDPTNNINQAVVSKYDQAGVKEFGLTVIESGSYLRLYSTTNGSTVTTLDTTEKAWLGNWHMGLVWYDSTADLLYLQLNNTDAVSVANASGIYNGNVELRVGSMKGLTSFDFDGAIGPVAIGKNYLPTPTDRAFLWSLISSEPRGYWNQVTCEGDSITSGYGVDSGDAYPAQLDVILSDHDVVTNVGAASNTLNDIVAQGALTNATAKKGYRNLLAVWAGTNDMYGGESGSDTYTELVSYCQARQAIWTVIVLTCLPRSGVGTPADFETQRAAFNGSIRTNWATFASALVDIAADTRVGDAGDELDTIYYQADETHGTAALYAIVAAAIKNAIDAL